LIFGKGFSEADGTMEEKVFE